MGVFLWARYPCSVRTQTILKLRVVPFGSVLDIRTTFSQNRFCVAGISQVDKHGLFRCMIRSNRGRDTGRDTCRAVGSWSHSLSTHRDLLVNNAGIFEESLQKTQDGHEMTYQVLLTGYSFLTESVNSRTNLSIYSA